MADHRIRDRALDAVRELPDDATSEDAMVRLYFLAKIDAGEKQADAGQTPSPEEAQRRIFG